MTSSQAYEEDKCRIQGEIVDAVTEYPIENAKICILDTLGTVLCDSMAFHKFLMNNSAYETVLYNSEVSWCPIYRLSIVAKGYEPQAIDIITPKDEYFNFGKIMMHRPSNIQKLNEVTVTATRVKMVMKGDTIEYDATAFQLQEGSMLDELISMLPGASLDNNGRISVNGRFVSELLVNGRKFFSGDPQIALRNLPAYTVKKVQVYQKTPMAERDIKNRDRSDDPLVMDVALKKEYINGWIANAEGGYGSGTYGGWSPRWMGRLFGMRYTRKSFIAIHSSANNLNDPEAAGSKGEWRKPKSSSGEIATKRAGLEYHTDWRDQNESGISTKLNVVRQSTFNTADNLSEAYLTGGNTFSRSQSAADRDTWHGDWHGGIDRWSKTFIKHFELGVDLRYENGHLQRQSSSAESNSMLPNNFTSPGSTDFMLDMIYLRQQHMQHKDHSFRQNYNASFRLDKGFWLTASASAGNGTRRMYGSDNISYPANPSMDINRLRREYLPARDYSYTLNPSWKGSGNQWRARMEYAYSQNYNRGERTIEELNKADNEEATPSMQQDWAIDYANSYRTTRLSRSNALTPSITYLWGGSKGHDYHVDLSGCIDYTGRNLSDFRNREPHAISRHDWRFDGNLSVARGYKWEGHSYGMGVKMDQTLPDIMQLLDVRDSSNPLVLELGNPNLHKATKYGASAHFYNSYKGKILRSLDLSVNYTRIDNALARTRTFNRTTGITTWQPSNINGNWSLDASINTIFLPLQPSRDIFISNRLQPVYSCSADFSSDTDLPVRSEVDNWTIRDEFEASYDIMKGLYVTAKINIAWTSLHSKSGLFDAFDYTDVNYGVRVVYNLPGEIRIDTDLMAYCRRGYEERSMNTTDWVWNLQLSKSFGKTKQFTAKAIGFDLLHQLPTVKQVVTPQGRTESRYNSQPAYAILTLAYRLDIKPRTK